MYFVGTGVSYSKICVFCCNTSIFATINGREKVIDLYKSDSSPITVVPATINLLRIR